MHCVSLPVKISWSDPNGISKDTGLPLLLYRVSDFKMFFSTDGFEKFGKNLGEVIFLLQRFDLKV